MGKQELQEFINEKKQLADHKQSAKDLMAGKPGKGLQGHYDDQSLLDRKGPEKNGAQRGGA